MDDLKWITDYLNTGLGAAGLAGATFAANWLRKVIKTYMAYIEAKVARWASKSRDLDPIISQAVIGLNILRAIVEKKYGALESLDPQKRELVVNVVHDLMMAAMPEVAGKIRGLKSYIAAKYFGRAYAGPSGG